MMKSLLIPLTYLCLQTWLGIPQAKCQRELSMMDDAFDDQYIGCANKMEKKAGKLLKTEMSPFSQMWEKATEKWNNVKTKLSPPKGFKDEYGIAIVAYTDSTTLYNGKAFPTIFNVAVRTAGISQAHYTTTFQFKAFHYYLTIALQLLRKSAGGCDVMYNTTVYRGVPGSYKDWNSEIRFGHFASSSIEKEVAERFRTKKVIGRGTLFTIQTCFGVKIWNYSYNPLDKEVLIPVHEKFSVTQRQGNNITLRSTNQTCSRFNCAYLGGEKNQICVDNSATRGSLAFPNELSPSLIGGSVILIHIAALKLFAGF